MNMSNTKTFEIVFILGLNNKEGGLNNDLGCIRDAFDHKVFSNLYCLQYLYLGLMQKYQIQAPLRIRFISFKDFNPKEEYFKEENPFYEMTEGMIEYHKQRMLSDPFVVSPHFDYWESKAEIGEWIDKLYKDCISLFDHPTNGLEAIYAGLTSSFEDGSHKVFVFLSDNDAKPLGGPYPIYKPEKCPESEEELCKEWEKISEDSTFVFFSTNDSVYQRIAEKWDNAYFYPIKTLFDFSRNNVVNIIKERTGMSD